MTNELEIHYKFQCIVPNYSFRKKIYQIILHNSKMAHETPILSEGRGCSRESCGFSQHYTCVLLVTLHQVHTTLKI